MADAKLLQAGLFCPADAALSLAKHMQAAYAAQRLHLPTVQQKPLHGTSNSSSSAADAQTTDVEDDPDQLGSRHHLLGVTPQQLRTLHMPSKKAAQKVHAPMLPLLEQRLEQQALEAVAAVAGAAAGPDAEAHVESSIEAKQSQLSALQVSCSEALLSFTQQAQGYLAELSKVQQLLTELGQCILTEQPHMDQLASMQLQFRDTMYDAKSMPALQAIQQQLQRTEQEMAAAVEQVNAELLAYSQLGDGFRDIVQDYAAVKAKSDELDEMLAHLHKVETEAAYY
ncbi:hypothetical protein COO60DRAFT_1643318 [Scenedesmus sp. NREL 46B-D3]|nr:hypothetical protein COO60DRAFT_1643318 [Scenedesmus sp. NREL 46B-D3]